MRLGRRIAVAAACIACIGCTSPDNRRHQDTLRASDPQRQILVMLRERSARHYQPGMPQIPQYPSGVHARELHTVAELARQYDFRVLSDWPMASLGVRCFLAEVAAGATPREVAARVAADPRVESAQAVQVFHAMGHNDPYYSLQTSAALLKLDTLHRIATGSRVRVAQIDTGVDVRHPDLQGQLAEIRNFVDASEYTAELHGTAVAGIIVARADNGIGIVGIAPGATLLPLRACWQAVADAGAVCTSFTLAKALEYVLTQHVRVLNLSVAGPQDTLLARLIDRAIESGTAVVAALDPSAPATGFPANHANVIAVAALDTASRSARTIIAPGDHVLTTLPNGSFGFMSGSSFAAAHVTGLAALLLELSPQLKPADVAASFDQAMHDDAFHPGAHLLNACAMLTRASSRGGCSCCEETAAGHDRHDGAGHSP